MDMICSWGRTRLKVRKFKRNFLTKFGSQSFSLVMLLEWIIPQVMVLTGHNDVRRVGTLEERMMQSLDTLLCFTVVHYEWNVHLCFNQVIDVRNSASDVCWIRLCLMWRKYLRSSLWNHLDIYTIDCLLLPSLLTFNFFSWNRRFHCSVGWVRCKERSKPSFDPLSNRRYSVHWRRKCHVHSDTGFVVCFQNFEC